MQIAVITFDGFNEIDSFVAAHILNRLRPKGWKAFITSPDKVVTSMNGVVVYAERSLDFAASADAVIIGSGVKSREITIGIARGRCDRAPARHSCRAADRIYRTRPRSRGTLSTGRKHSVCGLTSVFCVWRVGHADG